MTLGAAADQAALELADFAAVGYIGKSYDKRIAGVLLTFPILNGIGILTGSNPLAVAHSIYAVVVFNGLVLLFAISFYRLSAAAPPYGVGARGKLIAASSPGRRCGRPERAPSWSGETICPAQRRR